jgi:hypothetical protein
VARHGGDYGVVIDGPVRVDMARITVIARAVHIHPTVAELIPTLLANLAPLRQEGRPSVRTCGVGAP